MKKELEELIKIYEKWLKNTKTDLEKSKKEFDDYPKADFHTAFLAKQISRYETEINVLEITLGDLKKILERGE